jgi:hypothetical protein
MIIIFSPSQNEYCRFDAEKVGKVSGKMNLAHYIQSMALLQHFPSQIHLLPYNFG